MVSAGEFHLEAYSAPDPLDLFSTSPTKPRTLVSEDLCCSYHAPFFACRREKTRRYSVIQGCCNHWDCPRCGRMVAAKHYGRIVEGCRTIAAENKLWFITITCRGKEVSADVAKQQYLAWTSKLLDTAYAIAKRAGQAWYYVQVTELQKRGHPHSHILTTFAPRDMVIGSKDNWKRDTAGLLVCEKISCLRSPWLEATSVRAGLGDQYDISAVRTVEAASRYVAKYMFKDSQFGAHFPKGWKRVRYSQSWPKLPERKTDAFVLLSADDWNNLASLAAVVDATHGEAYQQAMFYLRNNDVVIHEREERNHGYDRSGVHARI